MCTALTSERLEGRIFGRSKNGVGGHPDASFVQRQQRRPNSRHEQTCGDQRPAPWLHTPYPRAWSDGSDHRVHAGAHIHAAAAGVVRDANLGAVATVADPGWAAGIALVEYGGATEAVMDLRPAAGRKKLPGDVRLSGLPAPDRSFSMLWKVGIVAIDSIFAATALGQKRTLAKGRYGYSASAAGYRGVATAPLAVAAFSRLATGTVHTHK